MTMESYTELVLRQRAFFQSDQTKPLAFRLEALRKLKAAIRRHEPELFAALREDLNKSEFEAFATEIGIVYKEISFVMKHLPKWIKPQKVKTPLTHIGTNSFIQHEPYGVALIISPWNFPFQLALAPLVGAIAAGNCVIVKPSEYTPRTSRAIASLLEACFEPDYVAVVQGGVETSQALLAEPFDYLFFTGGVAVGKRVMEAASRHLTPVTLELGGKSPCIIEPDARLELAAKRIAWGKFLNAGQTCIAPDYVYVHEDVMEPFLQAMKKAIADIYGDNPLDSGQYTRIVSEKHFQRLVNFLQDGQVVYGGRTRSDRLMIEPTLLVGVTWQSPIMQEEIFGPLLPILSYGHLDEVIQAIRQQPKPLALYLFTENKSVQQHVLQTVSFGGGCINDTIYHYTTPHLPFGGVGHSGMGAYHGRFSFETFSHRKSILKQSTRFDLPVRYPHWKHGMSVLRRFMK